MTPKLPGIRRLVRLKKTGSTQDAAKTLAKEGAEHGTLVWADRQTRGRGRMVKIWHSEPGGLYFSLILKPPFPPSRLAEFSLMTAEAAAVSLSSLTGEKMAVKPPNDVMAVTEEGILKVCGILAEASGGAQTLDWLVVGVGVNVNNRLPSQGMDLPASSLKALTGRTWPLEGVLRGFLREFHRRWMRFCR